MDTANTQSLTTDEILETLKDFVRQVVGEEFVEDLGEMSAKSSFTRDLEMDSIEIVEFSERVKTYYGKKIDFTAWLSNMELEQIINLTLGDIASYIKTCLE